MGFGLIICETVTGRITSSLSMGNAVSFLNYEDYPL